MEHNLSKQEELRNRTKRFALRIIRLFRRLPRTAEAQVLGKQLLRSQPPSEQIIGRRVVPGRKPSSSRKWES